MTENPLTRGDHGDPLERLSKLALEADLPSVAEEADALRARIAGGLFYVACVGQFKRGKSTLLNALLGEAILPVGVTPVTAVVTILRHGQERSVRVKRKGQSWETVPATELSAFVTEERNPENQLQVEAVEIFHPSSLLASGMCLVDTPGIGSVFVSNTETTQAFVPHVDAALVILGADPPISGEELALVEAIAAWAPALLFVLNKADRLLEKDCIEAMDFTRRVLRKNLVERDIRFFRVSATERLSTGHGTRDWAAFEAALSGLSTGAGKEALRRAEARGVLRLSGRLSHHVGELIAALTRPVEESERRVIEMGRCVADAERTLMELGYLFQAEQDRIGLMLGRERDAFYNEARAAAAGELTDAAAKAAEGLSVGSFRDLVFESARQIAERHVKAWLGVMKGKAEAMYLEATTRFVGHANEFLQRLAKSGTLPAGSIPSEIPPEAAFRARSEFYFHYFMRNTSSSPVMWVLNRLRPKTSARRAILEEAQEYVEWLLYANTSRVEGDINQRILESRRLLEHLLRRQLQEVTSSAVKGLVLAKEKQQAGESAVKVELERLTAVAREVESLAGNSTPS